jgi:hypothetical protein
MSADVAVGRKVANSPAVPLVRLRTPNFALRDGKEHPAKNRRFFLPPATTEDHYEGTVRLVHKAVLLR